MVIGRYYKAKFWYSIGKQYIEVIVEPVGDHKKSSKGGYYQDSKIITGKHKGLVVAINEKEVLEEYFNQEVLMIHCAEHFI